MNDYISREAMLKNLTADLEHHSDEGDPRTHLVMRRFIKYVEDFPAADVQPVKRGRWEYVRNVKLSGTIKLCECNQCHNKIFGGLSYCGNCGARMDGDTE